MNNQNGDRPSYLIHYASEYYDPVKAHEYYMKNRELKGRTSNPLNDTGKEAKSYVSNQVDEKKQSELDTLETTKKDTEQSYVDSMNSEILSMITELQSMSQEDRLEKKNEFISRINVMREQNKARRRELEKSYREQKSKIKSTYDSIKKSELEKIQSDSSMTTSSSSSKTKSKTYNVDTKGKKTSNAIAREEAKKRSESYKKK